MGYLVYGTRAEADAVRARIDASLGWPKVGAGVCPRVRVGGGRHVDHPACCTVTHCQARQHPTLTLFAVPIDAASRPALTTGERSLEADLTADWERPFP